MCMLMTVHNCHAQLCTEKFFLILQTIITAQMIPVGGEERETQGDAASVC